ncbi:MAG: ABC transporter permease [Hyphomicrobiales bacterium]|nr:ABC transporter permease [Hyphomicrobiales bacterium]
MNDISHAPSFGDDDSTIANSPTPRQAAYARARTHIGLLIGGGVLLTMVVMALFAPLLAPHDPYVQDLANRLVDPFWGQKTNPANPFGTDGFGRDYLSRIIYGARVSLFIGAVAMLISGFIGTTMGVLAGYFGGKIDHLVTFLITVRLSMPVVLVALAVVAMSGGSLGVVTVVLGLLLWDRFAVVMRSATQQVRRLEFVTAAEAVGMAWPKILWSEILPNLANHLIVIGTLEMAHAIVLEAALSFLGLGVQPPTPSWGLMVSEAKSYMFFDPWLITIPGVMLFLLLLAINLLGDGVRDVTSPGEIW